MLINGYLVICQQHLLTNPDSSLFVRLFAQTCTQEGKAGQDRVPLVACYTSGTALDIMRALSSSSRARSLPAGCTSSGAARCALLALP